MTWLDLLRQLHQIRMADTPGPVPTGPPTPFGFDQAENQVDHLFEHWWQGGPLHPYLPASVPDEYTRPGGPSVPYEPFDEWTGRRVPL